MWRVCAVFELSKTHSRASSLFPLVPSLSSLLPPPPFALRPSPSPSPSPQDLCKTTARTCPHAMAFSQAQDKFFFFPFSFSFLSTNRTITQAFLHEPRHRRGHYGHRPVVATMSLRRAPPRRRGLSRHVTSSRDTVTSQVRPLASTANKRCPLRPTQAPQPACLSPARPGLACPNPARPNPARPNPARPNPARPIPARPSPPQPGESRASSTSPVTDTSAHQHSHCRPSKHPTTPRCCVAQGGGRGCEREGGGARR